MQLIQAGIVGGAGYTGGELIRILINHPQVNIAFVHSNSQAGKPVASVHTDLFGDTDLNFVGELSTDIDVLFLCVGHGDARTFLEQNEIPDSVKIIDLSQDFRPRANEREFVYGLPELNKEAIQKAKNIANPGCFATAIQLALLPLANAQQLNEDVHVTALTGSTGAGQSLSATTHFSWRNNNISVYKAFEHQHLNEIGESIQQAQPTFEKDTHFVPQRGDFARGIFASIYLKSDLTEEEAQAIFTNYYAAHPFTHVSPKNIDLKQVVNTNKCLLHVKKYGDQLAIISVIDNLLKGASGQAVQNMNLLFGLPETTGLKLKAMAF